MKVEKGIPVAQQKRKPFSKHAWITTAASGDSVLYRGAVIQKINSAVYQHAKRYGIKVVCRTVEGGVRVWVIE